MPEREIVAVQGLRREFSVGKGRTLVAVNNVDLKIYEGETVGLVGESGSGKSTLGRMIVGLLERSGGSISLCDEGVPAKIRFADRRRLSRQAQMIFQDPYTSLNPRMTVGDIIAEGPDAHGLWSRSERRGRIAEWLERVSLHPDHAGRYPHEFSGGQRQRIGIARALALEPRFVVCDEPISALDVSVQAQIVHLLEDLQRDLGLTYLFIAHDLSMIRTICHRMMVMYLGHVVEVGTAVAVYDQPQHPYTRALINANPVPDPSKRGHNGGMQLLEGEIASPINPKPGCAFAPRCSQVKDQCRSQTPPLLPLADGSRAASCFAVI